MHEQITLRTIKDFVIQHLWHLVLCACVGGIGGFLLGLPQNTSYEAMGSFKDAHANAHPSLAPLVRLFDPPNSYPKIEATAIMNSHQLLSQVVDALSLQGTLAPQQWVPRQREIISNLWLTKHLLVSDDPPFDTMPSLPQISSLHYTGEHTLRGALVFDSPNTFSILPDNMMIEPIAGSIGKECHWLEAKFVISAPSPFTSHRYRLKIVPTITAVNELQASLKIEPHSKEKGLVVLRCVHPNRHTSAAIVNQTMDAYTRFLEKQKDTVGAAQVAYLAARRSQLEQQLTTLTVQHAGILSDNITQSGFASSSKEFDFLAARLYEIKKAIASLGLEKRRIDATQLAAPLQELTLTHLATQVELLPVLDEIRSLDQQRRVLHSQMGDADGFQHSETGGLSLEIVADLLLQEMKTLITAETKQKELALALEKIDDPHIALPSLIPMLREEVSATTVDRLREQELLLYDAVHRSAKDHARIEDELSQQRDFLKQQLIEHQSLKQAETALLKNKLTQTRTLLVRLISDKLALLVQKIQDMLRSRSYDLSNELLLLEEEQSTLHRLLLSLPKQWISEQQMEYQLRTHQAIIEEITKLVESKNIAYELEMIHSIPVDRAKPPLSPQLPKPILWGAWGTILGLIIGVLLALHRRHPPHDTTLSSHREVDEFLVGKNARI